MKQMKKFEVEEVMYVVVLLMLTAVVVMYFYGAIQGV